MAHRVLCVLFQRTGAPRLRVAASFLSSSGAARGKDSSSSLASTLPLRLSRPSLLERKHELRALEVPKRVLERVSSLKVAKTRMPRHQRPVPFSGKGQHLGPFRKLKLVASASSIAELPQDPSRDIAFAGRSNVGKSSLLNALTPSFSARTSARPGETRTIDFYALREGRLLTDLPGYGFAFAKEEDKQAWSEAMFHYLLHRPQLRRLFLLIDSRHGLMPKDRDFLHQLGRNGPVCQIIFTKCDLVTERDLARRVVFVQRELEAYPWLDQEILLVSALSGAGIQELRTAVARHLGLTYKPPVDPARSDEDGSQSAASPRPRRPPPRNIRIKN
eukprot:m.54236 g.54236  ORF g.54236 m.54236 type:complete len:332 (-) comp6832_c0_seq3:51-1046(-)